MNKKNFNPFEDIGFEYKTRLVVYDDDSKEFIKKDIINELQSLDVIFSEKYNIRRLKYKYQSMKEGKWEDLTKYERLLRRKIDGNRLIANFNFSDTDRKNVVYLEGLDERQINHYMRKFLKLYYYYLLPSPSMDKINRIYSYIQSMPLSLVRSNNSVAHCYALMILMTNFIEKTLNTDIDKISEQVLLDWCSDNMRYEFSEEKVVGFKTGSLVAKGHIASLYDRNTTFNFYHQALELGKGFIENFLGVDPLSTYYPKINKKNTTYEIIDKYGRETVNSPLVLNTTTNICFSTDINYFQMYATNWANANFHFKGLVLNFGIVTNSETDYQHCVNSYQSILKGIAELLKISLPSNFRFFWIKSTVINKTVYACARFYLARYLIHNYSENVYISDIDQLVVGDFEKYLVGFDDHKYSVYQPLSSRYFSMLPGRSHLAGNIFIRNNQKGKEYCDLLTNYVGMGLEEEFSWILDQNATRYASEIIEVGNLNLYGDRALKQYPNLKIKLRSLN